MSATQRATPLTVGSLFSGIGGFDLAAQWMGWRTAWVSEIDPFACQVLAHHFPDAPNLGDITQIDFTTVEPVDVLVAGFPCQDISNAGKQAGITGSRSGLWFDAVRAIRDLRPRYVVVENVSALTNRGLDRVLGSLAEIGYDAEWGCFGAADVGAPHKRDRLWLLAYPNSEQQLGVFADVGAQGSGSTPPAGTMDTVDESGGSSWRDAWVGFPLPEPGLGAISHGLPNRLALRCLGNAIVPQCATVLYDEIVRRES